MRFLWLMNFHKIGLVYLNFLFPVELCLAFYCEFDSCSNDEYCCGENKCCQKSPDTWYLWGSGIGVLLILFILSFWARYKRNINSNNDYIPVSNTDNQEHDEPISEVLS